jgi:hypothetical protein
MARGLERFPPKRHLAPPFGANLRIPNGICSDLFGVWGRFRCPLRRLIRDWCKRIERDVLPVSLIAPHDACSLRVISGNGVTPAPCPFLRSKQTFVSASGASRGPNGHQLCKPALITSIGPAAVSTTRIVLACPLLCELFAQRRTKQLLICDGIIDYIDFPLQFDEVLRRLAAFAPLGERRRDFSAPRSRCTTARLRRHRAGAAC